MSMTEEEKMAHVIEVLEEARKTFAALEEIARRTAESLTEIWAVWKASQSS